MGRGEYHLLKSTIWQRVSRNYLIATNLTDAEELHTSILFYYNFLSHL
jgi:hypothetical protein